MTRNRKQSTREFKPAVTIYCPGITESEYFTALRNDRYKGLRINIYPQLGRADDFKQVLNSIKNESRQIERTHHYFFVTDMDVVIAQGREKEYIKVKNGALGDANNPVTVIESMPCIEFWFLLHDSYTDRLFPTYDSLKPVLLKVIPQYAKTEEYSRKIYSILKDKMDKAMKNSAKTMQKKESCEGDCSYTNMHELIELLDEKHRSS